MTAEQSIGRWVSLIHRQGQIFIGRELHKFNIGYGQFSFLNVLYIEDGLHQEDISSRLNIDKATTTRAISKLENEGYVRRERDPKDGRAYKVFLTQKGKEIKPAIWKVLREWTSILSSDFSDEEYVQVIELLRRMHENALQYKISEN